MDGALFVLGALFCTVRDVFDTIFLVAFALGLSFWQESFVFSWDIGFNVDDSGGIVDLFEPCVDAARVASAAAIAVIPEMSVDTGEQLFEKTPPSLLLLLKEDIEQVGLCVVLAKDKGGGEFSRFVVRGGRRWT